MRNIFKQFLLGISLAGLAFAGTQAVAEDKPFAEKKIVLQISDDDPAKQQMVLNVANNLIKEYGGPEKVEIEIVAFGPGLRLMFADNAHGDRIKSLDANGVRFTACSNTITSMAKILGAPPEIIANAKKDLPGVVRITELVTEHGYVLVKP